MKVLVLSATGTMGSGLIKALKDDKNHQLYAFSRNPESDAAKAIKNSGITLFKGDFGDKESVDKAFSEGFDAVFFTIFPDLTGGEADIEQATNIVDAVKQYGVKQLIYGSVARCGSQENFDRIGSKFPQDHFWWGYWRKKWAIDDLVRKSGAAYTIIKPPTFIQNVVLPAYVAMGYPDLPTSYTLKDATGPNTPIWWVDGSDVGRFAADAIYHPEKYRNKEFTFGTELLSANQIVEKLRKVSGKDVKLYEWPADEWETAMAHPYHSTKRAVGDIGHDPEGGVPEEFSDVKLTSMDEYLQENKAGTWME